MSCAQTDSSTLTGDNKIEERGGEGKNGEEWGEEKCL